MQGDIKIIEKNTSDDKNLENKNSNVFPTKYSNTAKPSY